MNNIIIALDGPAGSGKTTTAKLVAEELSYLYIDTGAMYRAVTLAWLRSGKDMSDEIMLDLMNEIEIDLKHTDSGQLTLLNGEDVSKDIRLPEVTKNVSPVSAVACVREKLVEQQRLIARNGSAVLDGRDIGTVVFPNAELKIFLVASIDARAERRTMELSASGNQFDVEDIKMQIADRDHYDSTREHSPLRKANDAIEIDTSNMTIEEQVHSIVSFAKSIINS